LKGYKEGGSTEIRNPCGTVTFVVTKAIGTRYKARPGFELVTQVSGFFLLGWSFACLYKHFELSEYIFELEF
jgi:hypothetical protein